MKNFTTLTVLILVSISSFGQVGFTTQALSVSGSDLGLVDMNGDHLDDAIGVSATEIEIHYQQLNGTFIKGEYVISATYDPIWSMAVGDVDANGYNDLLWGDSDGTHIIAANSTGTAYSIIASSNDVFTQRTNFVDINNDGHLDAFVCDDIDPNEYYINNGDGTLTLYEGAQYSSSTGGTCENPDAPISVDQVGVPGGLGLHPRGGNYGSIWVDYDGDHDIDLFIAKCGQCDLRKTNELFRNNGDGTYTEVGSSAGLADPINTWSAAWGDYDNDGDMDCFVGSSVSDEPHKLMRNNGDGTFTDVSVASGVTACEAYYHESVFVDFNNDGYIDIYVNGDILYNDGDGTFTLDDTSGLSSLGGAFGDMNNDGFIDMFRNNLFYVNGANANNWSKVGLIGVVSNKNGIGARVEVNTASGTQIRDIRSGEGFKYMGSLNAYFGIGADTAINTITVYWPSGTVDVLVNPAKNQSIIVTEGETLSLQDSFVEDLIIYPNPTKGILNINATYGYENAIYSVFDMMGRRVLNSRFSSNTVDVSSLSSGNYILRIINEGAIKTQKFIKQ